MDRLKTFLLGIRGWILPSCAALSLLSVLMAGTPALADGVAPVAPVAPLPDIHLSFGNGNPEPSQVAMTVELFLLLTVLSLAPAILVMMTSFTRIVVVLSFLRQALGTAQVPPNQVMVGLSLFLTFFIMATVWQTMNKTAIQPYLAKEIAPDVALTRGMAPVRDFMIQTVTGSFRSPPERALTALVPGLSSHRKNSLDRLPPPPDRISLGLNVHLLSLVGAPVRGSFYFKGFLVTPCPCSRLPYFPTLLL